jgi:integrase
LRELVEAMAAAGLSPKSIVNHAQVVKLVVASAVNDDGDQLYPRKWNHDFIGLPIIRKEDQRRPSITESGLTNVLAATKGRYFALFALLAGTGLRIGEALGLKATDLSADCRVLYVRRSIWNGKEQTPNAIREVDIAEPLTALLREYEAGKTGYCSPLHGAIDDTTQPASCPALNRTEGWLPCVPPFPNRNTATYSLPRLVIDPAMCALVPAFRRMR